MGHVSFTQQNQAILGTDFASCLGLIGGCYEGQTQI